MVEIRIEPDLSNCVQTLAKAEYNRLTRELLASDAEDAELQESLETLRIFLESTHFIRKRSVIGRGRNGPVRFGFAGIWHSSYLSDLPRARF